MARRRKQKFLRRNGVVVLLVAVVAAFCILNSLEDKYGMELGVPSVDLSLPDAVQDFVSGIAGEEDGEPAEPATPVFGGFSSHKELKVHIQDMGQADSILIQGPKATVLIDAGENNQGDQVLRYLEEQGVEKIDILIGTHPHSDHIGGMDTVVQGIDVGDIILPVLPEEIVPTTQTYTDLLYAIASKGLKITPARVGDKYDLGGGATLTILGPVGQYGDLNNMSIVSRVTYGDTAFLFTGDAETASEADLLTGQYDLDADVLDVGHHGSKTSSSQEFLTAVSPGIATISCGLDNSYGHPHREVVERLQAMGVQVLRTDLMGAVVLVSDGETVGYTTQQ